MRESSTSSKKPDHTFKIVIAGGSWVGKSCLIMRYMQGVYHEDNSSPEPTLGVEFHIKVLPLSNNRCARLQIWDTAGQESFRGVTSNYYRGAHCIMLCYDVTKRDSFDSVKFWLDDIRANTSEYATVFLIGTKIDLTERRTSKETAQSFADAANVFYREISSKTGEGVEELFQEAVESLLSLHRAINSADKEQFKQLLDTVQDQTTRMINLALCHLHSDEARKQLLIAIKNNPVLEYCELGPTFYQFSPQDQRYLVEQFQLPKAKRAVLAGDVHHLLFCTGLKSEIYHVFQYTAWHIMALMEEDSAEFNEMIDKLGDRSLSLSLKDHQNLTALELAKQRQRHHLVKRLTDIQNEQDLKQLVNELAQHGRALKNFTERKQALAADINSLVQREHQPYAALLYSMWTTLAQLHTFAPLLHIQIDGSDSFTIPPLLLCNVTLAELAWNFWKSGNRLTSAHPIFKDIQQQKRKLEQMHHVFTNQVAPPVALLATLTGFIKLHTEYVDLICATHTHSERQALYQVLPIIAGVDLPPCFLREALGKQLTPLCGTAGQNIYGVSPVYQVGEIHFKQNPHAPGVEYMVSSLGDLLAGQGATPSELLKVIGTDGIHRTYQASKTVQGKELLSVLKNYPHLIEKLRPDNFSAMIILSLLTDPQDGKPDNYMVEFELNAQKQISRLRIVGIDNDVAFADPVVLRHEKGDRQGIHFVNIKNVLYFLPQMRAPIDLSFRKTFLKHVPELLLLDWLSLLHQKNQDYAILKAQGVFTEEEFSGGKALKRGLQLPIKFVPGTIKRMYRKLLQLHALLESRPDITHHALFAALEPAVAAHYDGVQAQHAEDILACTYALYRESIPNWSEAKSLQEQLAANKEYLTALALKTADEFGFEDNRYQTVETSFQELVGTFDCERFSEEAAKVFGEKLVSIASQLLSNKPLLHLAAETRNLTLATFLLKNRLQSVDVMSTQGYTYTALHIAASLGDIAMLTLLCEYGASLIYRDKQGHTALDKARKRNHLKAAKWLEEKQHALHEALQDDPVSNDPVNQNNNNLSSSQVSPVSHVMFMSPSRQAHERQNGNKNTSFSSYALTKSRRDSD